MLTRKLWVYERGSDLKYKTNITLPSFVRSRRFPRMVLTLDCHWSIKDSLLQGTLSFPDKYNTDDSGYKV